MKRNAAVATEGFLRAIEHKIADGAIGPSVLRGQGVPGMARAAQEYLRTLPLTPFGVRDETRFRQSLDDATRELQARFPRGARRWGAARKALNIFLRESLYNTYLITAYQLDRAESQLELPLDSFVASGLRELDETRSLPRWPLLKGLNPETSDAYQDVATALATKRKIARVHLDLELWLARRTRPAVNST